MLLRNVATWESQAVCDGKDYAELLIVPGYEEYQTSRNTVVLLFDPDPALIAQMKEAEAAKKAAANAAVGPAPTKVVNSVAFDPKTMSEKPAAGQKKIVFEGVIDGSGTFTFIGNRITYRHSTFDPPEKVTVNGKAWEDLKKPFELDFTPDYDTMKVTEMTGRDYVSLRILDGRLELYIDDSESSRDKYRVSVFFEKVK